MRLSPGEQMSDLVLTAQFIRVGSNPFGPKPKDVPVFAQLLVGGSGLWIFTATSGTPESMRAARIRPETSEEFNVLRTGFAIVDTDVPGGDAQALLDKLRAKSLEGREIELASADAATVSTAVSDLNVHLHITVFGSNHHVDHGNQGSWTVSTTFADGV
jgi:hypothetical protein